MMFAAVAAVLLIVSAFAWLIVGHRISTLLGPRLLGKPIELQTEPLVITADRFMTGSRSWPLPRSGLFDLSITTDSQHRLVIRAGGSAFTFGPIKQMWSDAVEPQYEFTPESGDVVTFTRRSGRFVWATPFHYSLFKVPRPRWRRNVYDRLFWTKPFGATLELIWRDEDGFYPAQGWREAYNNRLIRVRIHVSQLEQSVPV